jgi:hypothetical protein
VTGAPFPERKGINAPARHPTLKSPTHPAPNPSLSPAAPPISRAPLNNVASYGKQLGRIEEALMVMLDTYTPSRALTPKEGETIEALRSMVAKVEAQKKRHGR